ncbi:MAG: hypothetical protein QXR30_04895, partial [Candidatus Woesearchaeota archaeon]
MNLERRGLFVFLFVFLSIFSIFSINAKWCAYLSSDYVGCFELDDCSAIGAQEVSEDECIAPICCLVNVSDNKQYYGSSLSLGTQKVDLFDAACKNINKTISTYTYISSTPYEGSICQKFNLINNPGFHDLSSLGCSLNVRFTINDESGPLTGTNLELFQIEELDGNILFTTTNQYISSSQYSLNYFIPKTCNQIDSTIKLKIKITKSGYNDYIQEIEYNLLEGIDKIELIDLINVVMQKENNWQVTFNFYGSVPAELKDGFFIKYSIGSKNGQVFVRSNTNSVTVIIPKPENLFSGRVYFIINLPKYRTNSFYADFSSNVDVYDVDVPPFISINPLTTLNIKIHKNNISSCRSTIIGSLASSFYYVSFQLLYNSVTNFYEASIPIYSEKSLDNLDNLEKNISVTLVCNNLVSKASKIIENQPVQEIIMPQLENEFMSCTVNQLLSGVINKDSLCQKPCRKYYTFNCSSSICSFSNEEWNLVKNEPQLGLCDNGFTCDALGNCVPIEDSCTHTNSVLDCVNVDVDDGFYYCDENNKKIFVNLTKLYNEGNYDTFVFYCQKCSFDKECRTCNNPNSILGNKLGKSCNIGSNAICSDRLITKQDLQNINAGVSISDLYISKNLSKNEEYYDYCIANNCGILDNDCNRSCNNLSNILFSRLGVSLVCDSKENLSQIFRFGNCSDNTKFCGIPKSALCYGVSVLNSLISEYFYYLVESRSGQIINRNGINCSSIPIPEFLPEIGQTDKKLKEMMYVDLNTNIKDALNHNQNYFENNRHKVFGMCFGEIMNFNDTRYCCFNGPKDVPCDNFLTLTLIVKINYSSILEKGKNLVFKIKDLNANSEFIITTDEEGKAIILIPKRRYNFTLLHDLFSYSVIFNFQNKLSNTLSEEIIINSVENYKKLEGNVSGNVSSVILSLRNVDVKIQINNTFDMFQYTDSQGKFNFGYFNASLLENVTFRVNYEYSNPFFAKKLIQNINFSNASNPLPYEIYLNLNGNVNLQGKITDNSNDLLTGVKVTVLGLEELKPSNWFSDYKFTNISFNGSYELKRLPCNSTDPISLKILFEHEDYLPKVVTFNSDCSNTELNVTLQEKSCLKQEVKPENITLRMDNDGNLKIRWKFKCSPYVLGFAISLSFIDRTFVVADLIESNHSKLEYEYSVNLNDLGLLDYAGIRGNITTITIYADQVNVTALWEKPFINKTSNSNSESISFDYGCVKNFWFNNITGQYLKFVLNYSVPFADVWVCVNGTYVNSTGNVKFEKYLQNKTNPITLSDIYFTELTKYEGTNKEDIRSQFCSGPFLAFGTYFADKCKDLPLTKSYGLLYYYKSCVNVRNCYDYNTKTACLENLCLPFECEWRNISEINSSYAAYPSNANKLGVCIPKDPVLVDCSLYNLDINSNLGKYDLIPFMFNKNDVGSLNTNNPYFNITRIAELFGQRGDKRQGVRKCIYDGGNAVFDKTFVLPKHIKFINKFYFKSIEELRDYISNGNNYGIFDYDLIFDKNDQTYTFNFSILDINNSLPNISTGLPIKKYSLRNLNDVINLTNLTIYINETNSLQNQLNSLIVIDSDFPILNGSSISVVYKYTSPTKTFSYYALKLILNISNEDWVIAEGKLTPLLLYSPLGTKTPSTSYEVLDEFKLLNDGVFNYIEKPIFRMKYETSEDISILAKNNYDLNKGIIKNRLGVDYELNVDSNEFLILSGIYNLSLTLKDKLNNMKNYNLLIYLPKNGVFFKTGYYKYYRDLQNATIFVEPIISGLDLVECRFGPTYYSESFYYSYPKIYNLNNLDNNIKSFNYTITPSELLTLFNDPKYNLSGKPNGLFRIYSMCKDSSGNYYEVPEITFYYDNREPECNLSYYDSFFAYQNISQRALNLSKIYPTGKINLICKDEGERNNPFNNIEIYDPSQSLDLPIIGLNPLEYYITFEVFGNDSYFINHEYDKKEYNDNGWHYLTVPFELKYKGILKVNVSDSINNKSYSFNLNLDAEHLKIYDIKTNNSIFCSYDKPKKYDLFYNSNEYLFNLIVYNPSYNDKNSDFFKILDNDRQTYLVDFLDDFKITLSNGDNISAIKYSNDVWLVEYSSSGFKLSRNLSADVIRVIVNYSKTNKFSVYYLIFNNSEYTLIELTISGYSLNSDAAIVSIESSDVQIYLLETYSGNVTKSTETTSQTRNLQNNQFLSILNYTIYSAELNDLRFILEDFKGYSSYYPNINLKNFVPYLVDIYTESDLNLEAYGNKIKRINTNKYFCADDALNLFVLSNFSDWKTLVKVQIKNGSTIIYENVSNLEALKIENLDLKDYVDNDLDLIITLLPSTEYSCNIDLFANYSFKIMPILCKLPEIEYEQLNVSKLDIYNPKTIYSIISENLQNINYTINYNLHSYNNLLNNYLNLINNSNSLLLDLINATNSTLFELTSNNVQINDSLYNLSNYINYI